MSASRRSIGPFLAAALIAGNMIGSGIFLLPASLAAVGAASLIGWVLAALVAGLLGIVFAMLARLRPAGETMADYAARGLHPVAGFIAWLSYWIANIVGNIGILLATIGYGQALFGVDLPRAHETAVLLGLIAFESALVLIGPRLVGRMAAATLAIGLLPILAAIAIGAANFDATLFAASWNVSGEPLAKAIPPTVLTIFWAFLGVESANMVAAVMRDPQKNVPRAIFGGTLFSAIVYAAATVALFGLIPAASLAASDAPFADAIAAIAGPAAVAIVAAAAVAKTIGTAGGWFLVTAEIARSGAALGYLPKQLSEVDPTRRPTRDVLLMATLSGAVALVTASPTLIEQFSAIVNFTVFLFLVVYTLCALALVRFAGAIADPRARLAARAAGLAAALVCILVGVAALGG